MNIKVDPTHVTSICGVPFCSPSSVELTHCLNDTVGHAIYTPNAEMLVFAHRDPHYRAVLHASSFNLCDGSGPAFFSRLFQHARIDRVTGTDFLPTLLDIAATEHKTVYLLGSGDVAVLESCKERFGHVTIVGVHPGIQFELANTAGVHTLVYDENEMDRLLENIIMSAPDILVVAFGHPKQELFIHTFLDELPSVRIAIGVGGALDFYAGKVPRAPRWLRTIGLESLWRLVLEPWRWKRVFTALVIFPILYIKDYVTKKH